VKNSATLERLLKSASSLHGVLSFIRGKVAKSGSNSSPIEQSPSTAPSGADFLFIHPPKHCSEFSSFKNASRVSREKGNFYPTAEIL